MASGYRLVIQMKGPTGRDVRFEDFLKFLFDLLTTLRATDRALAHSDAPTTDYRVADMSHNSPAQIVLQAMPRERGVDLRNRVLGGFVTGLQKIQSGNAPVGFNTSLILDYQELAKHLNGKRLREASFTYRQESARVSTSLQEKIQQIVGPDRRERGTISGMLEVINVHRRLAYFQIYPTGARQPVKCFFAPSLIAKVGEAIRRYVTVSGVLRFKANMLQPYSIHASGIDIHEPDSALPHLRDLRGLAPGATGDELSETFVRGQRDAW